MPESALISKQKSNCRAQLDFFVGMAKDILEKHGEFRPVFYLEKKPDGVAIVFPDFHDDESKDSSIAHIMSMLKQFDSDYFIHAAEAWVIQRKPEDKVERPMFAKDRRDALMVTYNQRDGKMVEVTLLFRKGKCGKIFFDEPTEKYSGFGKGDDFKTCSGRFALLRSW